MRQSNLSQRIKNPRNYDSEEVMPFVDPEAQNSYPNSKTKKSSGSLSSFFTSKSTSTVNREVSGQFDQFCFVLMAFGVVDMVMAVFVLSWSGLLVASFALGACLCSWWYCSRTVRWIMTKGRGTQDMQTIAEYIREGSDSYLRTQYKVIAWMALLTATGLAVIYMFRGSHSDAVSATALSLVTAFSFLFGAFCSALAGYTGVWTSVRCNLRVAAAAARYDYFNCFLLCFRAGAVSAILSASMCVLGLTSLYIACSVIFYGLDTSAIPLLLGGYGFGASFVALFMQLGGGIYTKAADVGADMCGKIEKGIPEDDPRNPAVIADLVGDNVGDCAGSMADVFESIAAEMIGTMILGATLAKECDMADSVEMFIFFPLMVHSLDLVVSMVGISMTIPTKRNKGGAAQHEDPIEPMKRGYLCALSLAVVLFALICRLMLYSASAPSAWWHFALCGLVGLLCAASIVAMTTYYTDYVHAPVLGIVRASRTGHGTNVIAGIAVGMESTALPALIISASLFTSYKLGASSGLRAAHLSGLFGTACATMGMLCTAVFVLSMNNFGPIADNAGGVVEMSEQPSDVRAITDRLDAVGNVTKAATKGYAVGGSALACFLLFNAFLDEVAVLTRRRLATVDLTKVEVMIAGIFGIAMVFLFVGWSIDAVGRTASKVVDEVRRQFREIEGLMAGRAKPQYARCVEIVTRAALREMVRPALLALAMPIIVGLLFRAVGSANEPADPLLGVECLAAFLQFGTMTGLLMAVFLDNAGGAWDNAKKLIESKNLKDTLAHAAAVTGDTVGDPFKDTAGPALHVVITTMSTTALVLGPMFVGAGDGDAPAAAALDALSL